VVFTAIGRIQHFSWRLREKKVKGYGDIEMLPRGYHEKINKAKFFIRHFYGDSVACKVDMKY